jgi:Holliday junction DNA helicase RuvA
VPVLIGFLNEVEREFFERFITVSGIGPKAALRAFTKPIPAIARAIDEGDMSVLRSLPGIGEQRAKEIIAKLQGKVGKYALIQTKTDRHPAPAQAEVVIEEEAVAILLQLEYRKHEAKAMVKAALARNPNLKSAEEILNEVYRQRQAGEPLPTHERSTDAALTVG